MRLLPTPIATTCLCLALTLTLEAPAQTTVPASVARPMTKPADAVVGNVKPVPSSRPGPGAITPATVAPHAQPPAVGSNAEMGMLQLKSVQDKRSTQTQMATSVMGSASGATKVTNNIGR